MKKLKKISLELNKEVVSNLSNDNLNHFKGGATDLNTYVVLCCAKPISVPNYDSCPGPISEKCPRTDTCPVGSAVCGQETQGCIIASAAC